jgi:hypothetical protein
MRTRKTQAFDPVAQEQDRNGAAHEDELPNHKPKTELLDQAQAGLGITDQMRKSTQRPTVVYQAETEGMTDIQTKIRSPTEDWALETKNQRIGLKNEEQPAGLGLIEE